MTEAPLNPRANRDHIAEIFFETMRAPALFLRLHPFEACTRQVETTGGGSL
jgi:centractin